MQRHIHCQAIGGALRDPPGPSRIRRDTEHGGIAVSAEEAAFCNVVLQAVHERQVVRHTLRQVALQVLE